MIHNMTITSKGTRKNVVIDGVDVSDKISYVSVDIDPESMPSVHLTCTPMNLTIYADSVKIFEHVTELKEEGDEE